MSITLTRTMRRKASEVNKFPQLVLEIDGVDTLYGVGTVKKFIKIGDPGLTIGGGWVIGGYSAVEDQSNLISFQEGTTTKITQQLDLDKGRGSTVSSMQISLVDKLDEITRLISPGVVVDDIMGRRCKLWLGFKNTAWKEDFIIIFRGIVDEINSKQGIVTFNLAEPTQKQRSEIFTKFETILSSAINNSVTTIPVDDISGFLLPVNGPSGSNDTSLKFYVRIGDEIIRYTGASGGNLTGCTRAQLGTVAASHDDESNVDSFYRLTGNVIDLALKLMLSGWNDYFLENVEITNFNFLNPTTTVANSIFFPSSDLGRDYGIVVGDYLTTTGASNGANNVTLKTISEIVNSSDGSYIVVDGVTFVDEIDSDAVIKFRSKYDTLGEGLGLNPDEVDITQHEYIRDIFLSSFNMDFYLKDTITGKDFIQDELYRPAAAYSVPRKSRASIGYHVGPIPGSDMITLNLSTIKKPDKLSIKRSINKNFANTIIYKFDEDPLEDRFLSGDIEISADSKNRIDIGTKSMTIVSKGMRTSLGAQTLATSAANRRLNRYQFGAEYIESVPILYGEGFSSEVGDITIVDNTDLQLSDTSTGERGGNPKMFEVVNKTLDFKTGDVALSLVNTSFSGQNRYSLIGPASLIKTGISSTQFIIKPSGLYSIFGADEYLKWKRFKHPSVKVRSKDYTTFDTALIESVNGNTITLETPLAFTPSADMIMELDFYNPSTEEIHLRYAFMRDTDFDDGTSQYKML